MECFICGAKGEKTHLFGAIMREGVVKICEDCSIKENIPIVRRITNLQLKESEKNQTIYEKLSKMAGIDPNEHQAKFGRKFNKPLDNEKSLRKIVEEKKGLSFPELKEINSQTKGDLIDNYHWAVFKARRARRLTQKQLAEAISEPEASIKLVERGVLPDDYPPFIKKLQVYLGIVLFNKYSKKDIESGFDPFKSKEISESDLENIKEQSEKEIPYWKKKLGFLFKKKENPADSEEIVEVQSVEDINPEEIEKVINDSKEISESERIEKLIEKDSKENSSKNNSLTQEEMDKILFSED